MGQTVHALGTWSVCFPGVRLLVSWNGNNDQTCVGVYHVCLWTPLTAASIQVASLIPPLRLSTGLQSTEILPGRLRQAWCIADKPRLVTLTCLVFRGTITTKSPVTTDVQLILQLREFRFCPRSDVSLPPTYLLELLLLSHKHSAVMRRILRNAMLSTLCLTFSLRQRQRRELKDMYHCPRFRARGD